MAKQPYIQFYLGDYIKDTRILPLNVKGGWVDLILNMWDNSPKGELTGTIQDFARIMNCDTNEADLVIQTLKRKNIFDYRQVDNEHFTIISRKQKKMVQISETRKKIGELGGNPALLNQKSKDNLTKKKSKDNLNTEYEYDNETENNISNNVTNSLVSNGKIEISEIDVGATIEFIKLTKDVKLTNDQVKDFFKAFKINNSHEVYSSRSKGMKHFREWLKLQNFSNGTNSKHVNGNSKSAGAYELLEKARANAELIARRNKNN
jgi:uncharacterized protein YdaU (DUF1376 family)